MMPRNASGAPINPRDYNRSDGFSPGQTIVTRVPGLDTPEAFRRTGAVPVNDMARAYDRRQPIVVINARTRRRHLIWAELDSNASARRQVTLLIHPGVNFREGERYIVALRRLRRADGRLLRARRAFRVYRDRLPSRSAAVKRRRAQMERIFRRLRRARISRRDLYLAWDFTVASRSSLAKRMLSIRNRAFARLGDRNLRDMRVAGRAPAFSVDRVEPGTAGARRVYGTFTVPCYLNRRGCPPGSRFRLSRRGLPVRSGGNSHRANFICIVPPTARGSSPGRAYIFGHGLLGSADAVLALEPLGSLSSVVVCATDWIGFAREDIPEITRFSGDLSGFPRMPDRTQQGILDFMFLGRLMVHPDGFSSHAAFRDAGRSVIDTRRLFYVGGSQGGILGGALTAVAPDHDRAVLAVPAMNYSLLLPRSIQFDPFRGVLFRAYPNELQRALILSMMQVLWDRGDANGYAWHLTRAPYRNTPRHTVLLQEAFGDHQVTNVATEVEARTIGAYLRTPALDPGRSLDRRPFYRIRRIPSYPWRGNALAVSDIGPLRPAGCEAPGGPTCAGTGPPPPPNLPNRLGQDPHGVTPFDLKSVLQTLEFLKLGGAFVDTCGSRPCYAGGWNGPG